MAYGMAKIQNHTETRFALVDTDNIGLHFDGGRNHIFQRFAISLQNCGRIVFHETKKPRIADHACLDALKKSSTQLAVRKSPQQIDIGEDGARMVEATDQVFSGSEVCA